MKPWIRRLQESGVTAQRGIRRDLSTPLLQRSLRILSEQGIVGLISTAWRGVFRSVFYHPLFLHNFYCPWLYLTRRPRSFILGESSYRYFYHSYNTTWDVERAVEIPVAWDLVQRHSGKRILEVGNVLSHYFKTTHDIIDKFESAPGIISLDIADYRPAIPFDLIISISTIEHVGWDDDTKDPTKPLRVINALLSMLAPGGTIMLTVPVGYNPPLDKLLSTDAPSFQHQSYLKRISASNAWLETTPAEALKCRYAAPYHGANALFIGMTTMPPAHATIV